MAGCNSPFKLQMFIYFSFCMYSEELGEFMELKGANSPGILVLTTGLSKPFMRLDKYPTLLKELERHMEVQYILAAFAFQFNGDSRNILKGHFKDNG